MRGTGERLRPAFWADESLDSLEGYAENSRACPVFVTDFTLLFPWAFKRSTLLRLAVERAPRIGPKPLSKILKRCALSVHYPALGSIVEMRLRIVSAANGRGVDDRSFGENIAGTPAEL